MSANIITFTTQAGARGEAIAEMVASKLGFACYNRELITRAATAHGVSAKAIAEAERWPDFFERLGAVLSVSRLSQSAGSESVEVHGASSPAFYYHAFVEQEIGEVVSAGNCIVIDHGANPLLRRHAVDAFHVLIEGGTTTRARQLEWEMQLCGDSAQRFLRDADRRKKGFLNYMYEFDYLNSQHYDLVVNTDHLSNLAAAQLIVAAAASCIAEVNTAD